MPNHKALYAAFDVYPSAKGAATHIFNFATTLFDYFDGGLLYVLTDGKLPVYQLEATTEIKRFGSQTANFLKRTQEYSYSLQEEIDYHPSLELCHFRDIWSGIAILQTTRNYKTLFEVNALPSIELPYRYPYLTEKTLAKIREMELFCLNQSTRIVTPSFTTKNKLLELNIPDKKITVITNGADIPENLPEIKDKPNGRYIIYFGALQQWQGIDNLIRAFAGLQDYDDLHLVIISSNKEKYLKFHKKLAQRLCVSDKIIWKAQLPKEELYAWIKGAYLSAAPLTDSPRNIEQGCSPLKILESMACGTSVVASDLEPVRELIDDEQTGKLIRAGRPHELSRGIRLLLDFPELNQKISENALNMIKKRFTWKEKKQELIDLFKKIM